MAYDSYKVKFSYKELSLQAPSLVAAFLAFLFCVAYLAYVKASMIAFVTASAVSVIMALLVFIYLIRRESSTHCHQRYWNLLRRPLRRRSITRPS